MKTIVITGASSGIGEALALHYADVNVVLGLTGRDGSRLLAVSEACRARGAKVEHVVLDVSNRTAMAVWLEAFDDKHKIDLLIANAGVSGGGATVPTLESFEAARQMFAVNINGVCHTLDPVLPRMAARGRGQVALVASLAGYRGLPSAPAYAASKGFVKLYGEGLRGAMAPYGVAVNVICPGFVESRITAQNNFKMPFFMGASKAAVIIAKGLDKNRARIAFPAPMAFVMWLFAALPVCLSAWIANRLPQKH
jgi:short-subunit dehydrogenase